MKHLILYTTVFAFILISCSNKNSELKNKMPVLSDSIVVGGSCEGCEAVYESPVAFEQLKYVDTLPDYFEKGDRLLIKGIIYKPDGKTPAANVVLYVYHTDQSGHYAKKGNEKGWGKQHGYIRGWVKTNAQGEYAFYTLKPIAYPDENIPAHIHATIKEPGFNEYYIDEFLFDDDTLLTTAERKKCENRCGSGILQTEQQNNMLVAERNIILGLHIPGYPQQDVSGFQSGLLIGENLPAFDPKHISGPDKNKVKCPMCAYGYGQGILIFWNNKNIKKLLPILKQLDKEITDKGFNKIRVFAVYVNTAKEDITTVESYLRKQAMLSQINNCSICFMQAVNDNEYVKDFALNTSAEIESTFFIYRKRKVIDKFINYSDADVSALTKLLYGENI